MDFQGKPRTSMDSHGFALISTGLAWIFIHFHGFPWVSMDFHGFPWIGISQPAAHPPSRPAGLLAGLLNGQSAGRAAKTACPPRLRPVSLSIEGGGGPRRPSNSPRGPKPWTPIPPSPIPPAAPPIPPPPIRNNDILKESQRVRRRGTHCA